MFETTCHDRHGARRGLKALLAAALVGATLCQAQDDATQEKLKAFLRKAPEADSNGDGELTMQEARAYKNKIKKAKAKPASGAAPVERTQAPEVAASGAPLMVPSRDWDANHDGRIDQKEFKGPGLMFATLDGDGDGFLTGAETIKLDSRFDLSKSDDTTWNVPSEESFHGVTHHTYPSESMNVDVGYNIYLPDEYAASDKRYPVIYHLHGSGGNESSQVDLSAVYHRAIADGRLPPVIVVFVNGGRRSYYSDSADGQVMAETTIIGELLPHIDATYRTLADRNHRVLHGFSMGGFGALKLGMKFPERFATVISFCGGMAPPESIHMMFLRHIHGGDTERVKANSPADIAVANRDKLADQTIWLFSGTRDVALEDSTWAHEFLEANHIAHRFEISEGVGHAVKAHFERFGDDIFALFSRQFAAPAAADDTSSTARDVEANASRDQIDALAARLASDEFGARYEAAVELLMMGERAREAYPALIQALCDDARLDALLASQILFAARGAARDLDAAVAGLRGPTHAAATAAWRIACLGPSVDGATSGPLIAALSNSDKHVRNFITVALAMSNAPVSDITPTLRSILDQPDGGTPQTIYTFPRAAAAIALAIVGHEAQDQLPAVIEAFHRRDTWEHERAALVFAASRIAPDDARTGNLLSEALDDPSEAVRRQAAEAQSRRLLSAAETRDLAAATAARAEWPSRVDPKLVSALRALGAAAGDVPAVGKRGTKKSAPPVHESIALALGYLDSLEQTPTYEDIAAGDRAGLMYVMALGGVQQGIAPTLLEALNAVAGEPCVLVMRRMDEGYTPTADELTTLATLRDHEDFVIRLEAAMATRRLGRTAATGGERD